MRFLYRRREHAPHRLAAVAQQPAALLPATRPAALIDPGDGGGGTPHVPDGDWHVGAALLAYRRRHGLSDEQLATRLRVPVDTTRWLGMRRRPNPAAPAFTLEVEWLARAFGCDAGVLAAALGTE